MCLKQLDHRETSVQDCVTSFGLGIVDLKGLHVLQDTRHDVKVGKLLDSRDDWDQYGYLAETWHR